jgi:8-oxo-dGTP pyrophosphatase MutT (NUDIX family)
MSNSNLVLQSAAVAIRKNRICLVTTSSGKRWIIPKGHRESGDSSRKTARIEAWEEAGVAGRLLDEPIGAYVYERSGTTYRVTVHLMRVETISNHWPEEKKRKRRWLPFHKVCRHIQHPKLLKLIERAVSRKAG